MDSLDIPLAQGPSNYGWIIDVDYDADPSRKAPSNANAVGMLGPYNIPAHLEEALWSGAGRRFQMRYDDEVTLQEKLDYWPQYPAIYEGRCIVDQPHEDGLQEEHFGPLQDFGTPNVGAAWIFYWSEEKEGWIQL